MGQAAATAAARFLYSNVAPRDLDMAELQHSFTEARAFPGRSD